MYICHLWNYIATGVRGLVILGGLKRTYKVLYRASDVGIHGTLLNRGEGLLMSDEPASASSNRSQNLGGGAAVLRLSPNTNTVVYLPQRL